MDVSQFLLSLIVNFSNTFSLLSVFDKGYLKFYVFVGNWLIEREITLGEVRLFLSEDLSVIFVIDVLWFELMVWELLDVGRGLVGYWTVFIVGLNVYATNEAFSCGTYFLFLFSGDISISIDCFSWSDWRNVLPSLMFDETISLPKVWIFRFSIFPWLI